MLTTRWQVGESWVTVMKDKATEDLQGVKSATEKILNALSQNFSDKTFNIFTLNVSYLPIK